MDGDEVEKARGITIYADQSLSLIHICFLFGQAFTGWRTCWVPYEDMTGKPVEGMDEIRFIRKGEEANRIWIDQLITAVPIDPRRCV